MRPVIYGTAVLTPLIISTLCMAGSVSVKYLIDHRMELHNTIASVEGVVQETITGEKACPSCPPCPPGALCKPCAGGCAQPRIFLVDTLDPGSPRLMVLLREGDESFFEKQQVVVTGRVEASPVAVILHKSYE